MIKMGLWAILLRAFLYGAANKKSPMVHPNEKT